MKRHDPDEMSPVHVDQGRSIRNATVLSLKVEPQKGTKSTKWSFLFGHFFVPFVPFCGQLFIAFFVA
jgi:hypothetical protein